MSKSIAQFVLIFVVGLVGGIFGSQILWPLLVERPLFYKYSLPQTPTYVTETREIVVEENKALREAVEKVQKSVVAVRSQDSVGRIRQGSGLVLTSDGLVLTLNELLPSGGEFIFLAAGREEPARYQVLKRDPANNLALIKLELGGLSVVRFTDTESVRLGESLFLVRALAEPEAGGEFLRTLSLNEGVVGSLGGDLMASTMVDDFTARGAPVFDILGGVVGLAIISIEGRVNIIPATVLRSFAGI